MFKISDTDVRVSFLLVHICSKCLAKDDVVIFPGKIFSFSFSFFWLGMHFLQVSFLARCTGLLVDVDGVGVVDFVRRVQFSVLATFFCR